MQRVKNGPLPCNERVLAVRPSDVCPSTVVLRRRDERGREKRPDSRPAAEVALGFYCAAMGFDEMAHDRQTEPCATLVARPRPVGAIEALEDARQVLGADPNAG